MICPASGKECTYAACGSLRCDPEPEYRVLNLPSATDVLKAALDNPSVPMYEVEMIALVLAECSDDRDEDF